MSRLDKRSQGCWTKARDLRPMRDLLVPDATHLSYILFALSGLHELTEGAAKTYFCTFAVLAFTDLYFSDL